MIMQYFLGIAISLKLPSNVIPSSFYCSVLEWNMGWGRLGPFCYVNNVNVSLGAWPPHSIFAYCKWSKTGQCVDPGMRLLNTSSLVPGSPHVFTFRSGGAWERSKTTRAKVCAPDVASCVLQCVSWQNPPLLGLTSRPKPLWWIKINWTWKKLQFYKRHTIHKFCWSIS